MPLFAAGIVQPVDAVTLVHVRDAPPRGAGVEVFCVERHLASRLLGGALVFPGGKVDPIDHHPIWATLARAEPQDDPLRGLKVAACRETLEEGALLHAVGEPGALPLDHEAILALRATILHDASALPTALEARGLTLDLTGLLLFARWITPVTESRRFDTRFFLARAPEGQQGAHDEFETTSSVWASPRTLLTRFEAGDVKLAPPTHHTLETFAEVRTTEEAFALARTLPVDPILPRVDFHDEIALVLPGHPAHPESLPRIGGALRYVLHESRFLPDRSARRRSQLPPR